MPSAPLLVRPSRTPLVALLPAALAVATAGGCGATLPIDPLVLPAAAVNGNCALGLDRIEHVDEQTPLGFSAVDVLARLSGASTVSVDWVEPEASDEYVFSYGPEQGRSSLTLDVRIADGPILHRYSVPTAFAPEDTECDPGQIEIPVEVTLLSEHAALNERFEAVLVANVPYRGRITKTLEPRTLAGGLSFGQLTSLDPERRFELGPLAVDATLWEGGSMGSLSAHVDARYAQASKALRPPPVEPVQPGPLAEWPSARACDGAAHSLPSDAAVLGFSAADVLAQLTRSEPRLLAWSDGTTRPVRFELTSAPTELCQTIGETLGFDATLRAQGEEQDLDVELPVHIDAEGADGGIGQIQVTSLDPDSPRPLVMPRRRRADTDLYGYRAVLIGVEWTHSNEGDSGSLSLRGVDSSAPDAEGNYPSTVLGSGRW